MNLETALIAAVFVLAVGGALCAVALVLGAVVMVLRKEWKR